MPFWINEAKQGSKYATATCYKWDELSANCAIEFTECVLRQTETGIKAFFYATKFTDVKKGKADNFQFEPGLISIEFHDRAYDKREKVGDEWKTVKAEPSDLEVFWCDLLGEVKDPLIKGFFTFSIPPILRMMISTGVDTKGNKLDDSLLNFQKGQYIFVEPVNDPAKYVLDTDLTAEIKATGKSYGGGSSKAQSECDRLAERFDFFKRQLEPYSKDCDNLVAILAKIETSTAQDEGESTLVKLVLETLGMLMK